MKIDSSMKCGDTIDSLISSIYPGFDLIDSTKNNDSYLMEHTILCAKNHAVDYLISKCLNALQGEVQTYHSAESAILNGDSQENNQFPVEYMITINGSVLPISGLHLKKVYAMVHMLFYLISFKQFCL